MLKINMKFQSEKIKCPHIMKWGSFFCGVDEGIYVPSSFQMNEYCMTKEHSKCPFFLRSSEKTTIKTASVEENVAA
jgi:hypothetical protein